jgi:hypothetical protein
VLAWFDYVLACVGHVLAGVGHVLAWNYASRLRETTLPTQITRFV